MPKFLMTNDMPMNKEMNEKLTEQPNTTMTQSPKHMTQTLKNSKNMLASAVDLTETEQTLPPTLILYL